MYGNTIYIYIWTYKIFRCDNSSENIIMEYIHMDVHDDHLFWSFWKHHERIYIYILQVDYDSVYAQGGQRLTFFWEHYDGVYIHRDTNWSVVGVLLGAS